MFEYINLTNLIRTHNIVSVDPRITERGATKNLQRVLIRIPTTMVTQIRFNVYFNRRSKSIY